MVHHLEPGWQFKQGWVWVPLNKARYRKRLFSDSWVRPDGQQIQSQLRRPPEFLLNRHSPIIAKHSGVIRQHVVCAFCFHTGYELFSQTLMNG